MLLLTWPFFSLREFWLRQVVVHNEDLLTFLSGETVMIRCDKPNHNFTMKLLSPYYCPSCMWGFIGRKVCLLIPQVHEKEALASLESWLAMWFLGRSIFWSYMFGQYHLLWFWKKRPLSYSNVHTGVWSLWNIWKLPGTRASTVSAPSLRSSLWPYLFHMVGHKGVFAFIHSTYIYLCWGYDRDVTRNRW